MARVRLIDAPLLGWASARSVVLWLVWLPAVVPSSFWGPVFFILLRRLSCREPAASYSSLVAGCLKCWRVGAPAAARCHWLSLVTHAVGAGGLCVGRGLTFGVVISKGLSPPTEGFVLAVWSAAACGSLLYKQGRA